MATLTTSWKSYASKSTTKGGTTVTFYLEAKYSSQSVTNNTTSVQTRLRSTIQSGHTLAGAGYKFTCTYCSTVSGSGNWNFANEVITSGSSTVTHNNDGTKSISLSASAYNKYWNFTDNLSASVSLPTIARKATVTSAQNFNDEGNPTITFTNPGGFQVNPYLGFYDENNTLLLAVERSAGTYTSPYTFTMTTAERNQIRSILSNKTSCKVSEGVGTWVSGTNIGASSLMQTFTIVNANPTITTSIVELNQDVINLLGNSSASTIIQNVSRVRVTATPSAKKYATITKVVATNSGSTQTKTSGYTFDFNITNNSFSLTTTDSRNLTGSTSFTKTMLAYQKVKQNSFSVKRVIPTGSNIRIQLESVYYQQTFGSHVNAPTVKYQIGNEIDPQAWITLTAGTDYTVDNTNHKITLDKTLQNVVDYRESTIVFVEVSDLLSSWSNNYRISKGIPVFEFGDDEVQVNGDLLLADINRQNVINVRDALGSGGTTDYSLLSNKPQINGHTLTGNMSTTDIGINIPTKTSQLTNDSGFLTTITSSQVTTALGYTPQEEIENIDISSWTKDKMINVFNYVQNGELFRLKTIVSNKTYYYEPINLVIESGKSSFDYIDENNNIKHIEITYSGSGNPSKTETTTGIQEKITSTNKLDYSLLSNTPTIPTSTSQLTNDSGYITGYTETDPIFSNSVASSITSTDITNWNNKSDFSGDYDDLTNKPTIKETTYANSDYNLGFEVDYATACNDINSKYLTPNEYGISIGGNHTLNIPSDLATLLGSDYEFAILKTYSTDRNTSSYTRIRQELFVPKVTTKAWFRNIEGTANNLTFGNWYEMAIKDDITSYHDNTKQDTLVSGTNIKTINGATLLGSGDITIGGGGTATDVKINGTSITSGGEADIITEGTYNSSTNKIATMSDIPAVPTKTSDLTNDSGYITSSSLPQDSGWINAQLTSSFTNYGPTTTPQYRKIGKIVSIRGVIKTVNSIASNVQTTIFTLPSGYYSTTYESFSICQGSGMNRWLLTVQTNGNVTVSRYGTSNTDNIPNTAWLPFNITFMID